MIFGETLRSAISVECGTKQLIPERRYLLTKINLVRAALPSETKSWRQNTTEGLPVVIEKNRPIGRQWPGRIEATSYVPRLIVVAGGDRRAKLLQDGTVYTWAWVEKDALDVPAENVIQPEAFLRRIQAAVEKAAFNGRSKPLPSQPWPAITGVYPLHHVVTCEMGGKPYWSRFRMTDSGAELLAAKPLAGHAYGTLPHFMAIPPNQYKNYRNWGGATSEIMLQLSNTWERYDSVLKGYLDAIKNGTFVPLTPSFAPVPQNLVETGGIIKKLNDITGTSLYDFARWTAMEQTKVKDGKKVPKSKFAYAPGKDKSKWKLPIDTPGRAKNALSRINQVEEIPDSKKPEVLRKIRRAAKKHGIEVSDKPTSGQKRWAAAESTPTAA